MRGVRLSGTITYVPRLVLLAIAVLILCPAATAAAPPVVTISGTGDIAMAPSGSGATGFFDRRVRKALRADISLGNLEGTLATGGSSKCRPKSTDCFAFRAPPSYSTALKRAGFTIMNLANNHALDYGESGQAETIAALKRVGLRSTGRPGEIAVVRTGRHEGRVRRLRTVSMGAGPARHQDRGEARSASAGKKADIVVVTMHAGAEGADEQHVDPGPSGSSASRAATSSRSPTPSFAPAPTSSSATARTCCAGSSGTAGA